MEYKNTIITPKTDFPMKAGLPNREPGMLERWNEQGLYDLLLDLQERYNGLEMIVTENGYTHDEVVYVGDDYGLGGNDESVFVSDFTFVKVDDYTTLGECLKEYL